CCLLSLRFFCKKRYGFFCHQVGGVQIVQRTSLQRRIGNRWAGAFSPLCSIAYRHEEPGATVSLVAPDFSSLSVLLLIRLLASDIGRALRPVAWILPGLLSARSVRPFRRRCRK